MTRPGVTSARVVNRLRRWFLGVLMHLPGGRLDQAALLARIPDEALLPLRRDGLDPVPALGQLRDREPVSRIRLPLGLRGWLVTGRAEARSMLAAGADTFSNDFGNLVGRAGVGADQDPGGLGFADPPRHQRLRRLLAPHFTARALAQWAPRVREIVDDALTDLAAAGRDGAPVDLLARFAVRVPSRVIMELLGVPESDHAEFQRLSAARFNFSGGAGASFDAVQESVDHLRTIVARRRDEPGPGLIGAVLAEHGADIDDVELAGLADGVLTGGLETTVSMLALGALALLQDDAARTRLREDDELTEPLVEELLRYLSVVQVAIPRFARRDLDLAGRSILAGDVVLCSLSAANRDPRGGPHLDRLDVGRPGDGHLAFGHGLHRCVGAELARLELRIAYPTLVRRFPHLRLAVTEGDIPFRELALVYGLDALPVRLDGDGAARDEQESGDTP